MLSIIVPVRNESNIIHEVFDYFSNNLKDIQYEVLIINDYSNDETFNKCKKLVNEYKNFRIFDRPHGKLTNLRKNMTTLLVELKK